MHRKGLLTQAHDNKHEEHSSLEQGMPGIQDAGMYCTVWSGVVPSGVEWSGVVRCGVVWCSAVWCGQKAMAGMVLHAGKCKPGGLCV